MLQKISAFKPDFSIISGDFNVRSKSWWNTDINTNEDAKIDAVTSSYGLRQLISQQTHRIPLPILTSFLLTTPVW